MLHRIRIHIQNFISESRNANCVAHWNAAELTCLGIHLLVYLMVLVSHSILTIAWYRNRNIKSNDTQDFSILVILSDLLIAVTSFTSMTMVAFDPESNWMCEFQVIHLFSTHLFSLLTIVLYSYSAHQRIINNINLPVWKELLYALCGAAVILLVISIPTGLGFSYYLDPGGYYCMIDFTGKDDISIFAILSTIIFMTISILCVAMVYTSIYLKVIKATTPNVNPSICTGNLIRLSLNRNRLCDTLGRRPSKKQIMLKKLQSAARKSLLIPTAFLVCWGPYVILIVYQFATSKYPSPIIDQIVTLLCTFNPLANVYIFAFMNVTYNREIRNILGFQKKQRIVIKSTILNIAS